MDTTLLHILTPSQPDRSLPLFYFLYRRLSFLHSLTSNHISHSFQSLRKAPITVPVPTSTPSHLPLLRLVPSWKRSSPTIASRQLSCFSAQKLTSIESQDTLSFRAFPGPGWYCYGICNRKASNSSRRFPFVSQTSVLLSFLSFQSFHQWGLKCYQSKLSHFPIVPLLAF